MYNGTESVKLWQDATKSLRLEKDDTYCYCFMDKQPCGHELWLLLNGKRLSFPDCNILSTFLRSHIIGLTKVVTGKSIAENYLRIKYEHSVVNSVITTSIKMAITTLKRVTRANNVVKSHSELCQVCLPYWNPWVRTFYDKIQISEGVQ